MTPEEKTFPVVTEVGTAFSEVLARLHESAFVPEFRWSSKAFADLFATPGVLAFLASMNNEPAGFIMARSVADEAEILTLSVAPDWRRKNVARLLIETLLSDFSEKGISRIFLEVSVDNKPARCLYAATGFSAAGIRKRYYADGSDAEVMTKKIISSRGN
ncbi:ribosomal protein S18-alanine N-acetyltransferase [Acetobacter conturbans]|uniref:Ribosomal-protein-alanine N-acetyltransferase n=1 Tax=Acetobacter conturbans TaxID=1737472 RepID=A0ABX0K1M6_9PROT|nr:ribosomal protein S18-alanine N-acetyltransferase [Acetobacter conturbans]NHN89067.1 ribosomal-protein-alanine N-acetyltransferase [Acetobacter conturbans]